MSDKALLPARLEDEWEEDSATPSHTVYSGVDILSSIFYCQSRHLFSYSWLMIVKRKAPILNISELVKEDWWNSYRPCCGPGFNTLMNNLVRCSWRLCDHDNSLVKIRFECQQLLGQWSIWWQLQERRILLGEVWGKYLQDTQWPHVSFVWVGQLDQKAGVTFKHRISSLCEFWYRLSSWVIWQNRPVGSDRHSLWLRSHWKSVND
jgi:hypothetical protein